MSGKIIPTVLEKGWGFPRTGLLPTLWCLMVSLRTDMAPVGVSFSWCVTVSIYWGSRFSGSWIFCHLGPNQFSPVYVVSSTATSFFKGCALPPSLLSHVQLAEGSSWLNDVTSVLKLRRKGEEVGVGGFEVERRLLKYTSKLVKFVKGLCWSCRSSRNTTELHRGERGRLAVRCHQPSSRGVARYLGHRTFEQNWPLSCRDWYS